MLALSEGAFHAVHYAVLFGLPALTLIVLAVVDTRRTPRGPSNRSTSLDSKLRVAIGLGPVQPHSGKPSPRHPRARLVALAAAGSAAAGIVHAFVVSEHFREYWLYGIFFVLAAAFQISWAIIALRRPGRLFLQVGMLANAAIIVLYIVTRTTGLPLGPGSGEREAVNLEGILSVAAELVVVVACLRLRAHEHVPDAG